MNKTAGADEMLNAGSSLISTIVASKFNIPVAGFSVLQLFLSQFLRWLWHLEIAFSLPSLSINMETETSLTLASVILFGAGVYWIVPVIWRWISQLGICDNFYTCQLRTWIHRQLGYYSYNIDNSLTILSVVNWLHTNNMFIEPYPECYLMKNLQLTLLDKERDMFYNEIIVPDFSKRHYFRDPILDVHGYIVHEKIIVPIVRDKSVLNYNQAGQIAKAEQNQIIIDRPQLRTHIVLDKNPKIWIEKICVQQSKGLKKTAIYELYVNIDLSNTKQPVLLTAKEIESFKHKDSYTDYFMQNELDKREQAYIKTFFHPLRDQIWNTIKLATFSPDILISQGHNTQFLACLYGPPGTGKSSLPVRIAAATGKSLVRLDKSMFYSKAILRKFFNTEICINTTNGNTLYQKLDRAVIVLDEFDHIIKMIMDRSKKTERNEKRKNDIIDCVIKQLGQENGEEGKTGVNHKMFDMLYDEDIDDDVTVDDLLDIIQGPSFDQGLTMFATTNNYEWLRQQCPRLFRDGRFKPIYFGYPDIDTLNQISQFYYGKNISQDLSELTPSHRIPTCRVLNHVKAMVCCYPDDLELQYQSFKDKLRHDLNYYALSDCFKEYETCIDTESTNSSNN